LPETREESISLYRFGPELPETVKDREIIGLLGVN
jgi:hypothetical protein